MKNFIIKILSNNKYNRIILCALFTIHITNIFFYLLLKDSHNKYFTNDLSLDIYLISLVLIYVYLITLSYFDHYNYKHKK